MQEKQEVRRDDGELCGFVATVSTGYQPLTIFSIPFGSIGSLEACVEFVRANGLLAIRDRWLAKVDGKWQEVLIQEANTTSVRVTTDIFGGGGKFGESHTFEAGTNQLKQNLA